jgi:hypothetical protein
MRHVWMALLTLLVVAGCTSAPAPTTRPADPETKAPASAPKPASCADWPKAVAGPDQVLVWFHCAEEPKAVLRSVPAGTDPLQAAYAELLKGPNAEEQAAGFQSWFKAETAGALRAVSLTDGLLVVDLADVRAQLNGASTSAGSRMLVAQLGRTGAQFMAVKRLELQLAGSCQAFGDWIQTGCGVFPAEQFRS